MSSNLVSVFQVFFFIKGMQQGYGKRQRSKGYGAIGFQGAKVGASAGVRDYDKEARKKRKFKMSNLPGAATLSAKQGAIGEVRMVDIFGGVAACPSGLAQWVASNAGIVPLNVVNVGSAYYQRDGSQIAMKSLSVRMNVAPTGTNDNANVAPTRARIGILYDKGCNGALPVKSQVWLSTDYANSQTQAVGSYMAPGAKDRFVVLRDDWFVLPQIGVNGAIPTNSAGYGGLFWNDHGLDGNQGSYVMNWHINLNRMLTSYKASTGVIGDILVGALYLFFITDESVATADSAWSVNYNCRLKFYP